MAPNLANQSTINTVIAIFLAFILGGAAVYFWQNPQFLNSLPFVPQPKACTMEAKLCPDGSSVGRVPPNCDFAPCSSVFIRLDKISPGLQERLEKSQANERIKVAIWVKEKPGSVRSNRHSPDEKEMTQKEIDDFLAEIDKENARIVEETIKPVVIKLGNMGIFEVETDTSAPIIYTFLTPEVIKTISVWEEILSVDEGDIQAQPG